MRFELPHVSITVAGKDGDAAATGKLSILSVGFGIHQAWIYAAMFGASTIFESNAIIEAPTYAFFTFMPATLVFMISIVVFGLSLLFASFTDQRFLRFYVSKRVLACSATLTSLSTLSVFAAGTGSAVGMFALLFAGIGTGIGSAHLLLCWGTAFSRHSAATIVVNTATAIVIAVAIYSALLHWIPTPFSGIVTALLPLIELIFLWQLTPVPYSQRHEIPIFNPLPIKRFPFILRFGTPVLIFGFALGYLRALSMQAVLPSTDLTSQLLACVAAGLAMILTLVTLFTVGSNRHWDHLFRMLIPFIVIALLAMPFLGTGESLFVNLLLLVGFMTFEALMWILFGELAQEFRISPIFIFGLGRGLLALSSCAGSILALYGQDTFYGEILGRTGGAILLLFAMVVAYMLLPRQREIKEMVAKGSAGSIGSAIADLNEQTHDALEHAASENPSSELDDFTVKGGRFRAQCEIIANRYLLSRRETEVLYLLAKGHNAAYIQDKLCISRSTAKTHISHIYRKLDIHTQQELLSMLDSVKEEALQQVRVQA